MKRKTQSIAKLVDKAAKRLQLLVRLKAADDNGYVSCVTCGTTRHYKDMQGGHFIERGKLATKLLEENIHPQCPGCNCFQMKNASTVLKYRNYMVDMYGDDMVKELERSAWQKKKYYRGEVTDFMADINEQIKFHQNRVGG
jgi:hypothetical protein